MEIAEELVEAFGEDLASESGLAQDECVDWLAAKAIGGGMYARLKQIEEEVE